MPPLNRTFAFAEVNEISLCVGKNLNFDMPRADNRLFNIDRIIAKTRRRFGLRGIECVFQIVFVFNQPHSLAAAASRSLEHYRKAELFRCMKRVFGRF